MKRHFNWKLVPTALLSVVAIATAAHAQVQTPLPSEVVVRGNSGGTQSSSCGFIAGTPSQTVRVTEPFTSLRFRVQGSGRPTIYIRGADGSSKGCAMADSQFNGSIQASGIWETGTYSVYIGDMNRGSSSPYTLSITQQ